MNIEDWFADTSGIFLRHRLLLRGLDEVYCSYSDITHIPSHYRETLGKAVGKKTGKVEEKLHRRQLGASEPIHRPAWHDD